MLRFTIALLLTLFAGQALATPNWTGMWDTRWRGGGARLSLTQEGDKVTGRYATYDGVIEGSTSNRVLKAHWRQGERDGDVEFVLAADGQSFIGRLGSGEWWTGGRIPADPAAIGIKQGNPRETLRTFIDAGNAARYDAPDQMTRAVATLDFGPDWAKLAPERKLGMAQTLFNLVDQTTFRLMNVPDGADGDPVTVTFAQAGTDAKLPLTFKRTGERWFIVMPDEAALEAARKALYARTGGKPSSPEAYKLRQSARDTMRSFTRAFYEWDLGGRAQALSSLDLSEVPEAVRDYQGNLTSQYLNGIFNRIGVVAPQEISDDPQSVEPFVAFSHPDGRVVIAPNGTGDARSWKFSAQTVRNARDLYVVVEDMPAVDGARLPPPPSLFFKVRKWVRGAAPVMLTQVGPLEAWQATGWVTVAALAIVLGYGLARMLLFAAVRLAGVEDRRAASRALRWPLWGTVACGLYGAMMPAIGLPELLARVSVGTTGVLLALSAMWLGWIVIDAVVSRFFVRAEGRMSMDNILVSLGFGALKIALIAGGLTYIAMQLSLPYEGVIASLSIGGLAVAFASRETISNVFGAGILAIDRPFRRGDWIAAGDTKGTVEHVGIRSTRVRTADDSLVVVPNGKLSDAVVNNLGTRRVHLNTAKLPLPYETSVPQIEALVDGVKDLVAEIPESTPERTMVSVSSLSNDGIELTLKYGLDVRNGANETEIVNRLMMNVLRLCERLGIRRAAEGGMPQAA